MFLPEGLELLPGDEFRTRRYGVGSRSLSARVRNRRLLDIRLYLWQPWPKRDLCQRSPETRQRVGTETRAPSMSASSELISAMGERTRSRVVRATMAEISGRAACETAWARSPRWAERISATWD